MRHKPMNPYYTRIVLVMVIISLLTGLPCIAQKQEKNTKFKTKTLHYPPNYYKNWEHHIEKLVDTDSLKIKLENLKYVQKLVADIEFRTKDWCIIWVTVMDSKRKEYTLFYYEGMPYTKEVKLYKTGLSTQLLNNVNLQQLIIRTNHGICKVKKLYYLQGSKASDTIPGYNNLKEKLIKGIVDSLMPQTEYASSKGFYRLDFLNFQGAYNEKLLNTFMMRSKTSDLYFTGGVVNFSKNENDTAILYNEKDIFPSSFDWRNVKGVNYITSVKKQRLGHCWAFSAAGFLESRMKILKNDTTNLDFSEQFIIDSSHCTFDQRGEGGNIFQTLNFIKCKGYIYTEKDIPYMKPIATNSGLNLKKVEINIDSVFEVKRSIQQIKQELISNGPVIVTISYNYSPHALLLIGYGTVREGDTFKTKTGEMLVVQAENPFIGRQYWILKDSQGKEFGDQGYWYLAMYDHEFWDVLGCRLREE